MKRIVALVCLVGLAGGCSSTQTNPYAAYPAAPAYVPGPAYPAAPATTYAAPAPTVVQPAAYQQCCTPVPCCR
jgi:hypothetical protein